jgi:hypothetical protein
VCRYKQSPEHQRGGTSELTTDPTPQQLICEKQDFTKVGFWLSPESPGLCACRPISGTSTQSRSDDMCKAQGAANVLRETGDVNGTLGKEQVNHH